MTAIMDGRSQIKVHTDEQTQVHRARSSLTVIRTSTNRCRRCLTSVKVPLSYRLGRHRKINKIKVRRRRSMIRVLPGWPIFRVCWCSWRSPVVDRGGTAAPSACRLSQPPPGIPSRYARSDVRPWAARVAAGDRPDVLVVPVPSSYILVPSKLRLTRT